jgi:hypothetical protein
MNDDFYGLVKSDNQHAFAHESSDSSEQVNTPSITSFFKPVFNPQKSYFSTPKNSNFLSKKDFLRDGRRNRNKTARASKSVNNANVRISKAPKLEASTGRIVSSPAANRSLLLNTPRVISSDLIDRSFFPSLSFAARSDWYYPLSLDSANEQVFFFFLGVYLKICYFQDTNRYYTYRQYQMDIVTSCLISNTLVCIPTGLGKTFIAAVVLYNFYRWFPNGIVCTL